MQNVVQGGRVTTNRKYTKTDERVQIGSRVRVVYVCKRTKYIIDNKEYVTVKAAQKKAIKCAKK